MSPRRFRREIRTASLKVAGDLESKEHEKTQSVSHYFIDNIMNMVRGIALSALVAAVVTARECLPAYEAETTYVGCYLDPNSPRDLAGPLLTVGKLNSPQYCANICGAAGYKYSGVEFTMYVHNTDAFLLSGKPILIK